MYLPYLKRLVDLQSLNLKPKKWQSPPSALNGSFNCSIYWMHWLTKNISNYADCVFMFFTIIHIWQLKLIRAIHCITSANDIFPHYYKIDVGCIGGSLTVFISVGCFDSGWMKTESYPWQILGSAARFVCTSRLCTVQQGRYSFFFQCCFSFDILSSF